MSAEPGPSARRSDLLLSKYYSSTGIADGAHCHKLSQLSEKSRE